MIKGNIYNEIKKLIKAGISGVRSSIKDGELYFRLQYGLVSGKRAESFEWDLSGRTKGIHKIYLQGKGEGDSRLIWQE